jgi:hypothetical protein
MTDCRIVNIYVYVYDFYFQYLVRSHKVVDGLLSNVILLRRDARFKIDKYAKRACLLVLVYIPIEKAIVFFTIIVIIIVVNDGPVQRR